MHYIDTPLFSYVNIYFNYLLYRFFKNIVTIVYFSFLVNIKLQILNKNTEIYYNVMHSNGNTKYVKWMKLE